MRRLLVWLNLLLLLGEVGGAGSGCASHGTSFAFAFPLNQSGKFVQLKLLAVLQSSASSTTVTVSSRLGTHSYNLASDAPLLIELDASLQIPAESGLSNGAVQVSSAAPISLTALSEMQYGASTAVFTVPPASDGWTAFTVASPPGAGRYPYQVTMSGHDATTSIHLRNSTHNWSVTTARGQAYTVSANDDLTGLVISSSGPLTVVSANDCGLERSLEEGCDFEASVLLPSTCLGTDYVYAATEGAAYGNGLTLVGSKSLSWVEIGGGAVALAQGQIYRSSVEEGETGWTYSSNDQAFAAFQIGRYISNVTAFGDPAFVQLTPFSLWNEGSVRFGLAGLIPALGWTYRNYASIIVPACAEVCLSVSNSADCTSSLVSNGRRPNYFVAHTCRLSGDDSTVYEVSVACPDSAVKAPSFSLQVYGYTLSAMFAFNPSFGNAASARVPLDDCPRTTTTLKPTTTTVATEPPTTTTMEPTTTPEPTTTTAEPTTTTRTTTTTPPPTTTSTATKPTTTTKATTTPVATTTTTTAAPTPKPTLPPTTRRPATTAAPIIRTTVPVVPPTGSASPFCSGHGSVQCKCEYGYSGTNCASPIDWCKEPLKNFEHSGTVASLCSPNGHCLSFPSDGAHCVCSPGFTGPTCASPIPGQRTDSRRCALYSTPEVRAANVSVGCPPGQRCLADRLNCGFTPDCPNPVGWCLPAPKVDAAYAQAEEAAAVAAAECVHGTPSCQCQHGWTGVHCETPVDFCNATCAGTGSMPLREICAPHGHCANAPSGAFCVCDHGWSGPHCETPLPNQVTEATRCILYATAETKVAGWSVVGCSSGLRCLTDRLNCGFQHCDIPIGWCLPEPSVAAILASFHQSLARSV